MKCDNTTPNNTLDDKQFILDDYIDNIEKCCREDHIVDDRLTDFHNVNSVESDFDYWKYQDMLDNFFDEPIDSCSLEDHILNKLSNIKDNLQVFKRKGLYHFKQFRVYCPECFSKKVNDDGYYEKPIILDREGCVTCKIKRYVCKHCGKKFSADISSIVEKYRNVSNNVMDKVRDYYSIFGASLRKIQEALMKMNNVVISHQEIQDILVSCHEDYVPDLDELSGYYVFDSLWLKIDETEGKFVYLLVLLDAVYNTIVSYKLVESETKEEIYNFIRDATKNMNRIAITTDLKEEYRKPLNDLGFKHQFCMFHAKKNIKKQIWDYVKENNLSDSKYEEFKSYLREIYKIYNVKTQDEVAGVVNDLIERSEEFPEIINQIINEHIQPYYKNLTYFIEDSEIEATSNLIERLFKDIFDKSIKNNYRTINGALNRFNIRFERWDYRNSYYY